MKSGAWGDDSWPETFFPSSSLLDFANADGQRQLDMINKQWWPLMSQAERLHTASCF
jgi:hypothetical protein